MFAGIALSGARLAASVTLANGEDMGKHFDLSPYGDTVTVKSFELEVLCGRDSMDAAARSVPPPAPDGSAASVNPVAFGISHRNQLIAQSISKVNGQPVSRPYIEWSDWSLRTQEFVVAAFGRLNEATKDEVADFLKASFGVTRPNAAFAPF